MLGAFIIVAGYIFVVNVFAYCLFAHDKAQAQAGGWRVSEQFLLSTALCGGWYGGLAAMKNLRHKTVKMRFKILFWLATGANVMFLLGLAYLLLIVMVDAYRVGHARSSHSRHVGSRSVRRG
jgi:uncharacterized membrane protein YsdA (DUF1294 family)